MTNSPPPRTVTVLPRVRRAEVRVLPDAPERDAVLRLLRGHLRLLGDPGVHGRPGAHLGLPDECRGRHARGAGSGVRPDRTLGVCCTGRHGVRLHGFVMGERGERGLGLGGA